MKEKLFVCFTMNVERIKAQSPTGGPVTWGAGEASAQGFCDFLLERGFPVTLLIVPDAAQKQARVLRRLHREGHECGLHVHPHSWHNNYLAPDHHEYLGGMTAEEQYIMIEEARDELAEALAAAPESFRPGNFSANDDTFRVLASLGFRCGSVSQPGRSLPRIRAVWHGAGRAVFRANRAFRLVPGDLDFVEIPVTVDSSRTDHWSGVGDTRLDDCPPPDILHAMADTLRGLAAVHAPVKHLCLFSHNSVRYEAGHGDGRLPILKSVADGIARLAAQHEMEVVGCTLSQLRGHYLGAAPA